MSDYTASIALEVTPSDPVKQYQIIRFKGDLDKAGLAEVKETIEKIVEDFNGKLLVFDFGKLSFINSEGIGLLLTVHYRLVKKNSSLVIIQPPSNIRDVLDVIGLLKIITVYDSWADFEKV